MCRVVSHEFEVVRQYRTFSNYIFTGGARCDNDDIPTRHPRAYSGQPMQPEHDRYSLAVFSPTDFVDTTTPNSIFARLKDDEESTSVAALNELAKYVHPTD